MRFSAISLLALPLLVAGIEFQNPLDLLTKQSVKVYNAISSYIPNLPNPSVQHAEAEAAAAKAGGKKVNILTLSNWKDTLQSSYKGKGKEEWWVLVTGGNKTCYGLCNNIETAFNESALAFANLPTTPHLGYLNCDQQPVLCNSWATGPPVVWIVDVDAPGKPTDIYFQGLNTTTTTAKSFLELHRSKRYLEGPKYDGYFHPFDGQIAQLGLQTPLGYFLWVFGLIPSWAFMIGVSFLSRTFMGRRMPPQAAAPGAPRAAAPGDATS